MCMYIDNTSKFGMSPSASSTIDPEIIQHQIKTLFSSPPYLRRVWPI